MRTQVIHRVLRAAVTLLAVAGVCQGCDHTAMTENEPGSVPELGALAGTYVGTAQAASRLVLVTVTLVGAAPGEEAGSLAFGQPYACRMVLEFAGIEEDSLAFRVNDPNGGFCMAFAGGTLDVSERDTGVIRVTLRRANGTSDYSGLMWKT